MTMNIAIIEDDMLQRTVLKSWLEDAGYRCNGFNDGSHFYERVKPDDYHLLLLDWEMPGMSGIELLGHLHATERNTPPVIFVTSRNSEEDIVRALRQGADDYMVKPARREELLARIEALTRRLASTVQTSANRQYGNIELDHHQHAVFVDGQPITLTHKEFALTRYLLENLGKLLSRDTLLEEVWGHSSNLKTRTVDTHISRLRRKLQLTPAKQWQLSAIYQHGYRLDYLGKP